MPKSFTFSARASTLVLPTRVSSTTVYAIKNDSLRQYLPWEQPQNSTEKPKEEVLLSSANTDASSAKETAAERRARRRGSSRAVHGDDTLQEHYQKAFFDEERMYPNYGGFSDGEMHWYALWVGTKREAMVGQEVVNAIEMLPPFEGPDGSMVERQAESWVPTKKVRKWSTRSQKITTQTLKYGDGNGGWLFLRCVMDNRVYGLLESHRSIRGYRKESRIEVHNGLGEVKTIPYPLAAEFVDGVTAWEELVEDDDDEDRAKAEIYGAGGGPISSASEKIDDDEDHVEFIDTGRRVMKRGKEVAVMEKRYKTGDYSGTYNNPSNWYQGDSEQQDSRAAWGADGRGRSRRESQNDDWYGEDSRQRRSAGGERAAGGRQADTLGSAGQADWQDRQESASRSGWGSDARSPRQPSGAIDPWAGADTSDDSSWVSTGSDKGSGDGWWDAEPGSGPGWLWEDAAVGDKQPVGSQAGEPILKPGASSANMTLDDDLASVSSAWDNGSGVAATGSNWEQWDWNDDPQGSASTAKAAQDPATDGPIWQEGPHWETGDQTSAAVQKEDQFGDAGGPQNSAPPAPQFKPGDKIQVVRGSFADFDGVVLNVDDRGQVQAELDIFSRPTNVTLGVDDVETY